MTTYYCLTVTDSELVDLIVQQIDQRSTRFGYGNPNGAQDSPLFGIPYFNVSPTESFFVATATALSGNTTIWSPLIAIGTAGAIYNLNPGNGITITQSGSTITFSNTLLNAQASGTIFGNWGSTTATPIFNLPGSADTFPSVNHTGNGMEYKTLVPGPNISITPGPGQIMITANVSSSAGGTVTSISGPPSFINWATPTSTPSGTLVAQGSGTILGVPGSATAVPTFIAPGSADTFTSVKHTGDGLEYKTIVPGNDITITPGVQSLTIARTSPVTAQPITVDNETASLPNSRQLAAGTNVTLSSDSTKVYINATSSGGGGGGSGTSTDSLQRYSSAQPDPSGFEVYGTTLQTGPTAGGTFALQSGFGTIPVTTSASGINTTFSFAGSGYALNTNPTFAHAVSLSTVSNIRYQTGFNCPIYNDNGVNAIYYRFSKPAGDTHYKAISCDQNGSQTVVDTGITPVINIPNALAFQVTGATGITFFVDGVNAGTITTHLPIASAIQQIGSFGTQTAGSGGITINEGYMTVLSDGPAPIPSTGAGGGTAGVTQITAGTNITISPPGGTGNVTINSSSGGVNGARRCYWNIPEGPASNNRVTSPVAAEGTGGTLSTSAYLGGYLVTRFTTNSTPLNSAYTNSPEQFSQYQLQPTCSCIFSGHNSSNVRYTIGLYSFPPDITQSDTPTAHAAYFRYSTGASDPNWVFITTDNTGVLTTTNTGIAFAVDTPHHFYIDATSPSQILGYIDGALVATNITHLPGATANLYFLSAVTAIAASAVAADIGAKYIESY